MCIERAEGDISSRRWRQQAAYPPPLVDSITRKKEGKKVTWEKCLVLCHTTSTAPVLCSQCDLGSHVFVFSSVNPFKVVCARSSVEKRISWLFFGLLHVNMFVFWRSRSNMSDLVGPGYQGCVDGSLMDGFSVFIQGLLAVLAFSTLMCKYLSLFKLNRKWSDVCVWCDSVFFCLMTDMM